MVRFGCGCQLEPWGVKKQDLTGPCNTTDLSFTWTSQHERAFNAIKQLVVLHKCLTSIGHSNLGDNHIFISTNTSNYCTSAVLSYGPNLQSACPVMSKSAQLSSTKLNYLVHKKELLAIVRMLKKWHADLLGVPFTVFTDHSTLENFNHQKHLSWCQAQWQEFLGQYNYHIVYLKGTDNSIVGTLSCLPACSPATSSPSLPLSPLPVAPGPLLLPVGMLYLLCHTSPTLVCYPLDSMTPSSLYICSVSLLTVASDPAWLLCRCAGYTNNCWCLCLLHSLCTDGLDPLDSLARGSLDGLSLTGVSVWDGLLFVGITCVSPMSPNSKRLCTTSVTIPWATSAPTSLTLCYATHTTGHTCATTSNSSTCLAATTANVTSLQLTSHAALFTLCLSLMVACNGLPLTPLDGSQKTMALTVSA